MSKQLIKPYFSVQALHIDCRKTPCSEAIESCYGNQEGAWRQGLELGSLPFFHKNEGGKIERRSRKVMGNACISEKEDCSLRLPNGKEGRDLCI